MIKVAIDGNRASGFLDELPEIRSTCHRGAGGTGTADAGDMMPTVAIVDGVKIQFYFDEHPPPHFHAVFAEFAAQIRIDPPRIVRGLLPPANLATVLDWAARNYAGLMDAWVAVAARTKPMRLQ